MHTRTTLAAVLILGTLLTTASTVHAEGASLAALVKAPPHPPTLISKGDGFELWLEAGTVQGDRIETVIRAGYTLSRKSTKEDGRTIHFSTGLIRTGHRRPTYFDGRIVGIAQDKERLYVVLYQQQFHGARPVGNEDPRLMSTGKQYRLYVYGHADGKLWAMHSFSNAPRIPPRVLGEVTTPGVIKNPPSKGVVIAFGQKLTFEGKKLAKVEPESPGVDPKVYAAKAENAKWQWEDAKSSTEQSAKRYKGDYKVTAERESVDAPPWAELTVRVKKGDDLRFEQKAHHQTPFHIVGDVLYYVDYHLHANGTRFVAYDLKQKRRIYHVMLKGVGSVPHFRYNNRVTFDTDGKVAVIYGRESVGRYVEFVDLKTGATVGHKRFNDK